MLSFAPIPHIKAKARERSTVEQALVDYMKTGKHIKVYPLGKLGIPLEKLPASREFIIEEKPLLTLSSKE